MKSFGITSSASSVLAILALALAPTASAVCGAGEVGIGVTAEYQCGFNACTLTAENPGIYANNCNSIAFSSAGRQTSPCKGSYGNGYGVQCDGSGNPNFVQTTGGNFNNCYRISNGQCSTGPLLYINVYFCCKRA